MFERKDLKTFKVVLLELWVFSLFGFASSKCYVGCASLPTLEKPQLAADVGFRARAVCVKRVEALGERINGP